MAFAAGGHHPEPHPARVDRAVDTDAVGLEDPLHLDAAHRGLGTASCGPDLLDRYRLRAGRYEFSYRIALIERPGT